MSYFLCVDCGGSKTAVAIVDSTGAVVAHHTGGPSNLSYLGVDPFLEEIRVSVQAVLLAAGVEQSKAILPSGTGGGHFMAAWFGVSGCDTPEAVNEITPKLCALLSLPIEPPFFLIANDTTLLAAPLADAAIRNPEIRTCVAAVGGTGSIAASFRLEPIVDGEPGGVPNMLARIGGWGWILGDEGGGFHIGREAVRQLLREHELAVLSGAPLSPPVDDPHTFNMRTRVLSFFGVKSAPELLALLHDPDPVTGCDAVPHTKDTPAHRTLAREKRLSQLSPLVFRAAFGDSEGKGGGDSLALSVLKSTAGELAGQIALLCVPPAGLSAPLAIPAKSSLLVLGGSPVGIPAYRALLLEALKERGHEFDAVEHVTNAAEVGARVLFNQFASMKQA